MMINFMVDHDIPFEVVATKTDKLSKTQLKASLEVLEKTVFAGTGIKPFPFSSVTREGRDSLMRLIETAIED